MNERCGLSYKRLFEIKLFHHYWLDEGATIFDLIADHAKKADRLMNYDIRRILSITPTATTAKTLKACGSVIKNTSHGLLVAVPGGTAFANDSSLEWIVTVKDTHFFNYTALTLPAQKIYEFHRPIENKTYRYKENIPVLSNLTGDTRGTTTFLSQPIPPLTSQDQIESLIISGTALQQLTSDQPGASISTITTQAKNLPVFVHQGDIPAIVAPSGLVGILPARGIHLSTDMPDNVFALIRLHATRADNDAFSIVNSDGHAKSNPPVFQIRLKNRSTIWQYFNKKTNAVVSTELYPLPLTHFGNAGTKQKPSEGWVKAEKIDTKITRLVSEIFV